MRDSSTTLCSCCAVAAYLPLLPRPRPLPRTPVAPIRPPAPLPEALCEHAPWPPLWTVALLPAPVEPWVLLPACDEPWFEVQDSSMTLVEVLPLLSTLMCDCLSSSSTSTPTFTRATRLWTVRFSSGRLATQPRFGDTFTLLRACTGTTPVCTTLSSADRPWPYSPADAVPAIAAKPAAARVVTMTAFLNIANLL